MASTALSLRQIEQAIDLRVQGKTFTEIALELGVSNGETLRRQVLNALQDRTSVLQADVMTSAALDLARLESMIPENLSLARQGSYQHVKAVIQILRQKQETLEFMREVAEEDKEEDNQTTLTVNSPEYLLALERLNEAVLEGTYVPSSTKASVAVDDLDPKELEMLHTQLAELDLNITLDGEDDD